MNNDTVSLVMNYGEVKANIPYAIIDEGYDFVTIRYHGKPMCIPNTLISRPQPIRRYENGLPTYEEILEDEEI